MYTLVLNQSGSWKSHYDFYMFKSMNEHTDTKIVLHLKGVIYTIVLKA